MPAEKKKLLILGVLGLVILGVGAFTLKGGSSAPAPKATTSGGHHRHHGSADAPAPTTGTNPGAEVSISKPGASSGPVNEADGGMGKPGNLAAGSPAGTPANGGVNSGTVADAPVAEQDFPERDPFDGRKFTPEDPTKAPTAPTAPPKTATGGSPKNLGRIPPLDVTGIATNGTLPPAGSDSKLGLSALNEKAQVPKQDDFEYTVSGVITGDRSAAVFVDSKGNQRLITLGGSVDGDATVVGITQSKVTVDVHGKKRTLSVGADTPTEKR